MNSFRKHSKSMRFLSTYGMPPSAHLGFRRPPRAQRDWRSRNLRPDKASVSRLSFTPRDTGYVWFQSLPDVSLQPPSASHQKRCPRPRRATRRSPRCGASASAARAVPAALAAVRSPCLAHHSPHPQAPLTPKPPSPPNPQTPKYVNICQPPVPRHQPASHQAGHPGLQRTGLPGLPSEIPAGCPPTWLKAVHHYMHRLPSRKPLAKECSPPGYPPGKESPPRARGLGNEVVCWRTDSARGRLSERLEQDPVDLRRVTFSASRAHDAHDAHDAHVTAPAQTAWMSSSWLQPLPIQGKQTSRLLCICIGELDRVHVLRR